MYLRVGAIVKSQDFWIVIVLILNLRACNYLLTLSDFRRPDFLNNLSLTPKLVAVVAPVDLRLKTEIFRT